MQIDIEKKDKAVILTPKMQSIDAVTADQFKEFCQKLFSPEYSMYILDMKNLRFIDSAGLGSLISIQKNLNDGQKFVLCNITEPISNIMQLTRLDKFFTICPSVSSAMRMDVE